VGDLYGFCRENIIAYNNFIENKGYGLSFFRCSNDNHIYHNNFLYNYQNAYDECLNIWNSEYPFGGNYWSDYDGIDKDKDRIGDVPYEIPGGANRDNYPLIMPHENVPFYVKITTPQKGVFYFMNREILPSPDTIIIGKINVTAIAFDKDGIEKVEFYLDNDLQTVAYHPPYYWIWKEPAFFKHVIKVVAFNKEKKYRIDEIIVWKFL